MEEVADGADCCLCKSSLHFHCAGITEAGYRRLGDRRSTWRCSKCKQGLTHAKSPNRVLDVKSSGAAEEDQDVTTVQLMREIKEISIKLNPLDAIVADIKLLKENIAQLQKTNNQNSNVVQELSKKILNVESRVSVLEKQKDNITSLQQKVDALDAQIHTRDQWVRLNNAEIKGVPLKVGENLLEIVTSIGSAIGYSISKGQINYITRVPNRDPNSAKPIIVCFNNRFDKEDFVAASRRYSHKSLLTASSLGLQSSNKIYVNDHLTSRNKVLLNKAKNMAQEKNYVYVWVKNTKILIRRNATSPILTIKTEADLQKIV